MVTIGHIISGVIAGLIAGGASFIALWCARKEKESKENHQRDLIELQTDFEKGLSYAKMQKLTKELDPKIEKVVYAENYINAEFQGKSLIFKYADHDEEVNTIDDLIDFINQKLLEEYGRN